MEEELAQMKKEEGERAKILLDLGSQRDRVALSIAQKLAKVCWGMQHIQTAVGTWDEVL